MLLRTNTYLNLKERKEQEAEGKRLFGRPRRRWKDNIKMGVNNILRCGLDASGL
jgi:hypothetical protein